MRHDVRKNNHQLDKENCSFGWSFPVLSRAQRSLAASLESFHFEWIGNNQTDDELLIAQSVQEFARLISSIEDERDRFVSEKNPAEAK